MDEENAKRQDIEEAVEALRGLSPIQVEVLTGNIAKFAEEQEREHLRKDFLDDDVFEYFSTRLAAHHASSGITLKKEGFEHILEHSFKRSGHDASRPAAWSTVEPTLRSMGTRTRSRPRQRPD